jgi:hypothetical protein
MLLFSNQIIEFENRRLGEFKTLHESLWRVLRDILRR